MSLWLYFFLLSTPMSANEQFFLLIFFWLVNHLGGFEDGW